MARKERKTANAPGHGGLDEEVRGRPLMGQDPKVAKLISGLKDKKRGEGGRRSSAGVLANMANANPKAARQIIASLSKALADDKADEVQVMAAAEALLSIAVHPTTRGDPRYIEAKKALQDAKGPAYARNFNHIVDPVLKRLESDRREQPHRWGEGVGHGVRDEEES